MIPPPCEQALNYRNTISQNTIIYAFLPDHCKHGEYDTNSSSYKQHEVDNQVGYEVTTGHRTCAWIKMATRDTSTVSQVDVLKTIKIDIYKIRIQTSLMKVTLFLT